MLKTPGIPTWVTIFALIVFVVCGALGLLAMLGQAAGRELVFGQGFGQDMKAWVGISWGGRQLGLALAAAIAVLLKSPTAYIAAFVGGVGRDVGDLIAELGKAEPSLGPIAGIVVFLIAGILGIVAAHKARHGSA